MPSWVRFLTDNAAQVAPSPAQNVHQLHAWVSITQASDDKHRWQSPKPLVLRAARSALTDRRALHVSRIGVATSTRRHRRHSYDDHKRDVVCAGPMFEGALTASDLARWAKLESTVAVLKWPGGAFEPCGLPDPPGRFSIRPNWAVPARHRTTTWTLHSGTLRRAAHWRLSLRIPAKQTWRLLQSAGRPKTVIVVAVARLIVVAVGRPHILCVVVERPPTQHAASRPSPFGS